MVLNKVGISDSCFQTIQKLECTCRTETQWQCSGGRRDECFAGVMLWSMLLCLLMFSVWNWTVLSLPWSLICSSVAAHGTGAFGLSCPWRAAVQHSRLLAQAVPGGVPPLCPSVTVPMSGRRGAQSPLLTERQCQGLWNYCEGFK